MLRVFLFLTVIISIAGKKENKKLFKWERSMIKEVYQIANKKNGYFISLGIASHNYPDTALQNANLDAIFRLPEVQSIFVQSLIHIDQVLVSQNRKDTMISKMVNIMFSQSQSKILIKKIKTKKLNQIRIGEKYYVASIAYVKQIDMSSTLNSPETTTSEIAKEFLDNIEQKFMQVYQDSLYAKFLKN